MFDGGGDGDRSRIPVRLDSGFTVDVEDPRKVRIASDFLRLLPCKVGGRGGTSVDGVVADRLSTSDGLSSLGGLLSRLSIAGRDGNLPSNPDERLDVRLELFMVVSSDVSNFCTPDIRRT